MTILIHIAVDTVQAPLGRETSMPVFKGNIQCLRPYDKPVTQ